MSMSARVTIDQSDPDEIWIELRQNGAEVTRFCVFVFVVLGALYGLIPGARSTPGWLLALLGIAIGWSIIALMSREEYIVDGAEGTITVRITSPLGNRREQFRAGEVAAVRLAIGGPDDDRRLVELVAPNGKLRLRVPRRLTTLSAGDQGEIGRTLADTLGVPLRGARMADA
jgi:hypothetical protein